jgi:hypothetical protein
MKVAHGLTTVWFDTQSASRSVKGRQHLDADGDGIYARQRGILGDEGGAPARLSYLDLAES